VIANLVDRGYLNYEMKIANIWPEFAQGGKENVTLTDLLGHRAGVTFLKRGPTLPELANLDLMAKMLAAQSHNFKGNKIQGYAGVTRGWYLNEIVRRVHPKKWTIGLVSICAIHEDKYKTKYSSYTLYQILKHEITPKLDVDFHLGIDEYLEPRISPLIGPPTLRSIAKIITPNHFQTDPPSPVVRTMLFNPLSIAHKALRGSSPRQIRPWPQSHNRPEIWRSEGPSYGGLSNARSLAKIAAAMANMGNLGDVELMSRKTADVAFEPLDTQLDAVVRRNITFTRGGWGIDVRFPGTPEMDWYVKACYEKNLA
jgi:CubicO group peptidase (beta-lactamase class C family)